MRCEDAARRLDDYIDGTLAPRGAERVKEHLRACPRCREEERGLRAVVVAARALPATVQPQRDLWPGVASRLSEERVPDSGHDSVTVARSLPRVLASAASVVIVAGAALLIGIRLGSQPHRTAPSPSTVPATAAVPAGVDLERAGREYEEARTQLLAVLRSRPGALDAGTARVVEHNIQVIDRAVAEIRTALSGRPADPALGQLLLATYRQEIDLLQQVTQLRGTA